MKESSEKNEYYVNYTMIIEFIKKQYRAFGIIVILSLLISSVVYILLEKEYEASYSIEYKTNQKGRIENGVKLLSSNEIKAEALKQAGITADKTWYLLTR